MNIINKKELINSKELADPGLHQKILNNIFKKKLNKNIKILILGAGTGVFDKKLLNNGFKNITSIDLNKNNYNDNLNTKFIQSDLNKDFTWSNEKYDLIIASEIIEHIENTAHFLRQLKNKLSKNGFAIVTTPNILEKTSISNLIFRGYFSSYTENAFEWGHINPIFPHIFKYHLKNEGLKLTNETSNRKYFSQLVIYSWKSYPYYLLLWFFSNLIKLFSFNKKNIEGVINIYEMNQK